jgi:hypothetical protein
MGENERGIEGTVCVCMNTYICIHMCTCVHMRLRTHAHNLTSKNCILPIQYVQILFYCVNKHNLFP